MSVTQKNVVGIHFAIISSWCVIASKLHLHLHTVIVSKWHKAGWDVHSGPSHPFLSLPLKTPELQVLVRVIAQSGHAIAIAAIFGKSNGGFSEGIFSNNRFVLKPDVAIASEVSIISKNSLAITDFHAKKRQHVQLFENPPSWNPPIRDSQRSLFSCGVTL